MDESDAITSSVSSGFLHSVSTIANNSEPWLATSIRSHKLWCQAGALLASVPLATKMSASKLICYSFNHPATFRFQSSTPPDNITLISANRKADESIRLSDWHWCCCSCYSLTWSSSFLSSGLPLLIIFSSVPDSEGGVIPMSKVCEYCSRFMIFWTMLCPDEVVTQLVF